MRCGDEHRWSIRRSGENPAFGIPIASGRKPSGIHVLPGPFLKEANMSAKQRRKVYGIRRETRRPRGWTRWFNEGMLNAEAENTGSVRLRTTLWGKNGG
jgi:hypothetical protein